jgi:predicted RNA-binding protein
MAEKHWILCGKPENWKVALRDEIWGLIPKFKGIWRYLEKGDRLLFYATSPVTGMIGFGRVEAKFRQDKPLWPEELQQGQVLYPFRFEFRSDYVLAPEVWKERRIKVSLPVGSYSAINFLGDQDIIDDFYKAAAENWHVEYHPPEEKKEIYKPVEERPAEKARELDHDTVKNMIFEIGRIHRYIIEKEYEMDGERLDVVWRRLEKSVPTYVFEIQVGGDVYHALAKLKHAYDLWNSNIFLIVDERYRMKVDELLSGTFHEIRNVINVASPNRIERIHSLQLEDEKLRREIGLL